MTATNIFYNFVGFRYSPPLLHTHCIAKGYYRQLRLGLLQCFIHTALLSEGKPNVAKIWDQ